MITDHTYAARMLRAAVGAASADRQPHPSQSGRNPTDNPKPLLIEVLTLALSPLSPRLLPQLPPDVNYDVFEPPTLKMAKIIHGSLERLGSRFDLGLGLEL